MQTLLKDLEGAILSGLRDAAECGTSPESVEVISTHPDRVRVTTRWSRDPSQSRNGGDYYYYRRYRLTASGVAVRDDWSCDFASYEHSLDAFYPLAVSSLEPIARLAYRRAMDEFRGQTQTVCPTCGR
jgi:hypothetical protein